MGNVLGKPDAVGHNNGVGNVMWRKTKRKRCWWNR